eukprot:gene536-571_t
MNDATERIYHAMEVCDRIRHSSALVRAFLKHKTLYNERRELIQWMRNVIPSGLWEARDSAVQILDAYLLEAFETNPKSLEDTTVIKYAAVASATIGSKLHSSSNYARPDYFSAFNLDDILFFERQIVMKTGSRMSTLATPAYFVDYVVSLLCSEEVGGQVNKEQILQMVNTIIGEFWEDGASLLFAPSTIAISAVIMSLSLLRMDCSKLVDSLPEFLLPNRAFPFFLEEDGKSMYLDVNTCMKAMERLTYIRSTYMTRSPTSVANTDEIGAAGIALPC